MEAHEDCLFRRLTPEALPVIERAGHETVVAWYGLEIKPSMSELCFEIVNERIPRTKRPLRCRLHIMPPENNWQAQLFYFAWQDKSGDVWLDLSQILLEEGVAQVTSADFPERDQYLKWQSAAQSKN